ncbi:MAG: 50S ribosomal protein L10 [Candidatus Aenigmatarchaeota archaeon]
MVKEEKLRTVEELKKLIEEFPTIGIANIHKFPSKELQEIRKEMRGDSLIKVTKKSTLLFALKQAKKEKIEELEKIIPNQPAIIFSNQNAFKLYSKLTSLKFETFAKELDVAPNDIIIHAGQTSLMAGPIISELTKAGIPAGVEDGKIAIKKDVVVVKKGEKISKDVANALRKLDIKPISITLNIVGFYENGNVYNKDVLNLVLTFKENLNVAHQNAINLSVNICYPTRETIKLLLIKAFNNAKAIERLGGVV